MVGNINIDPMDVVLNPRAAPVLHGIQHAVYLDLRAERIVAGHGDHALADSFAAGGDTGGILAAA